MAPARSAGALALFLVGAVLAAGCAFRRGDPLPDDPPADFRFALEVRGAAIWPWDGRAAFGPAGIVEYDVTFREPPSNRRGGEPLEDEVRRRAWGVLVAAGFFDRLPVPKDEATGVVVMEGMALGLEGRWSGDPAEDGNLAALLDSLRGVLPSRVFRPLPSAEPPR